MAVSVVEVVQSGVTTVLSTVTATLATTPVAGDVIIASYKSLRPSGARTVSSVSGCGATWANKFSPTVAETTAWWAGTGGNASGTVTVTQNATGEAQLTLYLIRGLTATTVVGNSAETGSNTTALTGPTQTADNGQIVLACGDSSVGSVAAPTFPSAQTPSGWTSVGVQSRSTSGCHAGDAYIIPTASASHRVDITIPTNASLEVSQIVLGDAVAGGISLTSPAATATAACAVAALTFGALTLTSPAAAATAAASPATVSAQALALTSPAATVAAAAAPGALTFGTIDLASPTAAATAATEPGVVLVEGSILLTSPGAATVAAAEPGTVTLGDLALTSPQATATASTDPASIAVVTGLNLTSPTATAHAAAQPAYIDGGDPGGWIDDLTGRALIGVTTSITDLYVPGAVVEPPAHVRPVPLIRNSYQLANLAEGTHQVHTAAEQLAGQTREILGVQHIWVDGVDRTYNIDGEVLAPDNLVSEKGQGDRSAKVTVRGQQVWHQNGDSGYSWLVPGAEVEVGIVTPAGARQIQWAGDLISDDANLTAPTGSSGGSFDATWLAQGPLVQAMQAMHQPLDRMDPTDIGIVVPRVLNAVLSRRYPHIPYIRTGIYTTKLGSYGQRVGDYVRMILATAWKGDRQYQLYRSETNPRQYRMQLTNTASVHWNLTAGAPGISVNLSRDFSQVTNVIYGRGTMRSGYHWMNRKYPYLLPYAPPTYFSGDTSAELLLGMTDADTINNGVTLLQNRLNELRYRVKVTGVMTVQTVDAVKRIQWDRGLTVDGRVGGQTWTSMWSIGATGADLRSVRLPLASDPRVEPFLYHANGAKAGPNPAYDRDWPRLEDDIDYGESTTLVEGIEDATQRVSRLMEPSTTGTLTLSTCPWEGARWLIKPGQNITLHGWRGGDVFLHIADVTQNRAAGTVTLTVDSAFRDALTVHEVRARNAESKADPGRRPGAIGRTRSTSAPDITTPFDGESPAGILPELTLRGGKWTVWPMALDKVGTLARVWAQTYDPHTRFGMLLFGREVMPNQLHATVGNILGKSRPWSDTVVSRFLDDFGFIEGWGQEGQACGYFPKAQSDAGATVTGEFRATSGVSYVSELPPFVWVAILPAADCRIRAEFDPKPVT